MSEADETLTIDVVSDVVCPWCYLGEKRLEAALAGEPQPVAVRWRPYQLDPTIPKGGLDRAEYMAKKFGRDGRLQSIHDNLTRLGTELGVPFAFDKIKRSPNTLDAHRLIRWALSAGVQGKVVDRLFEAYFVEGRDIGDRGVLIEIASECGLEGALVEKLLTEGADVDLRRSLKRRRSGSAACRPSFSPAVSASLARRSLQCCVGRWRRRGRGWRNPRQRQLRKDPPLDRSRRTELLI
jgi:predicted DsbA family dithiol-disulfide isomerase